MNSAAKPPISSPVGKITMNFSNTDQKIKLFSKFGLIIYLHAPCDANQKGCAAI
jgi:hypothetical protein